MGKYYCNDNTSEENLVQNKYYDSGKGFKALNKEYLKTKKRELFSLTSNLRLRNQGH